VNFRFEAEKVSGTVLELALESGKSGREPLLVNRLPAAFPSFFVGSGPAPGPASGQHFDRDVGKTSGPPPGPSRSA